MQFVTVSAVLCVVLLGACGEPPPQTAANSQAAADTGRTDFIRECVSDKPLMQKYCECGWPVVSKAFPDPSVRPAENDPQLKKAMDDMIVACADELPAAAHHEMFVEGCVHDNTKEACECIWTALTKIVSPGDYARALATNHDRADAYWSQAAKTCPQAK